MRIWCACIALRRGRAPVHAGSWLQPKIAKVCKNSTLCAKVACMGLGNAYMRLLGYIVIQVQVVGVQGYDKDQIALVIPDLSNFVAQIPVILGTSTISKVINVMKEVEIDALAMPWANARVAHLLSVHRMTAM